MGLNKLLKILFVSLVTILGPFAVAGTCKIKISKMDILGPTFYVEIDGTSETNTKDQFNDFKSAEQHVKELQAKRTCVDQPEVYRPLTIPMDHSPFLSKRTGNQCTYTWITNDGIALTAFHCIEQCFRISNNHFVDSLREKILLSDGKTYGYRIAPGALDKIQCDWDGEMGDDGKFQRRDTAIRVLATGAPGWLQANDLYELSKSNPDVLRKAAQDGFRGLGHDGDFALIQVVDKKSNLPVATSDCVNVRTTPIGDRENVWNVAFPWLSRNEARRGYFPNVTQGVTMALNDLPGISEQAARSEFAEADLMVSSIDVQEGASGSTLLDSDNRISGVAIMGLNAVDPFYTYPSAAFIPVQNILKSFRAQLDQTMFAHVVNGCTPSQQSIDFLKAARNQAGDRIN